MEKYITGELKLKMKKNIIIYIFADGEYMHVLLAPKVASVFSMLKH